MFVQKLFSPMMRHYFLLSHAFCTSKSAPLELTNELITRLERLSALRMQTPHESSNLAEDINVAEHIFGVDTEGISPLYNVAEDYINCPLRDDISEPTSIDETLANARKTFEGFFVSPSVGVVDKHEKEGTVKRGDE